MTPLFILLLITSIWVPDSSYNDDMEIEYGYREVPITYGIEKPCGFEIMKGCYMSGAEPYIEFQYTELFKAPECALSIWDHEVLHAWGISHSEMQLWFNPCVEFHESQRFPQFPTMNSEGFYFR